MGQSFGVLDFLLPGKASEHGLAEQAGQQVAGVFCPGDRRKERHRPKR
jgi:hypothetical protein